MGTEVRRVEDLELIQGQGTYVGNLQVDGMLRLAFVRSPVAHADITAIDVEEARAAPGVAAVYIAKDLGLGPVAPWVPLNEACARYPLATDKVRFVGDPVAVVVAQTAAQAADAADMVDVDYDILPAVTDVEQAVAPDAPLQFEEVGSNVAAGMRDPDGTDPLAGSDVVVRARLENNRLHVAPMEGNAIAVLPGAADDKYELTLHVSTQAVHALRGAAARIFDLPPDRIRVIAPHVGGGFGGKYGITPEHVVAIAAARTLQRPVSWVESRSENMVAMPHGRSQVQFVELGLRTDGTIVGMRVRLLADAGSYAGFGGMLAMGPSRSMAQGVYRIPQIGFDVAAVLTNTTPTGPLRGAGRPEASAMLERIIDMAAAELGMDPVEIRRRNFIRPDEFPYTTVMQTVYDSGDYDAPLTEALRLADYEGLRAEQKRRRDAGDRTLLGIGMSAYVEITAGLGPNEYGSVEVHADGSATVKAGTSAHGQGHATSFAMLVSDALGIPMESITYVQADTHSVPSGWGTAGSRSLQIGGSAVYLAADAVLQQARELAASMLEASPADIEVSDGGLGVAGVPSRGVSWAQVAIEAERQGTPLSAAPGFAQAAPTFPFGAHVSVVEVDMDTGKVTPITHIAVDDCGRILNPLLVRGQQHGGCAQGIAQALWEQVRYDEDGNPLTATFANYLLPSAMEIPPLETANTETPSPHNPLGAKGIGESATVGSTPAVQNAVVDALSHLGVRHIDIPCTPQRVWRTIVAAQAGSPPDPWHEPPNVFAGLPVGAPAGASEANA